MNRAVLHAAALILFSYLTLSIGQTNEREDNENLTVNLSEIAEALPLSEEQNSLEHKSSFHFTLPTYTFQRNSLRNRCLYLIAERISFNSLASQLLNLPEELCEGIRDVMPQKRMLDFWRYINQFEDDKKKKQLLAKMRPSLDLVFDCCHFEVLLRHGFSAEEIFEGPFRGLDIKPADAFNYLPLLKKSTHLEELHIFNKRPRITPEETDAMFQPIMIALCENPTLQRIYWGGADFADSNTIVAAASILAMFPPGRHIFFYSQTSKMIKAILDSSLEDGVRLRVLELLRAGVHPENEYVLPLSEIIEYGLDLQRLLDLNFSYFLIDCVLDHHTLDILATHPNLRGVSLNYLSNNNLASNINGLIEVCRVNKNIEYFHLNSFSYETQPRGIIELVKNLNSIPNFKELQFDIGIFPGMFALRDLFDEEHHSTIRKGIIEKIQGSTADVSLWKSNGYEFIEIMELHSWGLNFKDSLTDVEISHLQYASHIGWLGVWMGSADNKALQDIAKVISSLPNLECFSMQCSKLECDLQTFEGFIATACSKINLRYLSVGCWGAPIEYKRVLDRAIKARLLAEGVVR
ncbi:hypothetical protein [Candidatus Odyssella thessalonicensis]|uniref:hypothetical protein n=1 Tax=Candidatus Odyssella thessalonicensis TaxID=84647 RepID=UPI000225C094|nr:hypothetical protein [Candidatus Odyssella thessalonicensis]